MRLKANGAARRGLGLVELVTGSGVIFTLIALQLPGIQQARESARRSQCVNNMKQLGLALHNYHSSNDAFPMSNVVGGPGRGNGQGCFVQLLPFMEQVAIYNAYNFHLENYDSSNNTATSLRLATFLCPSNESRAILGAADIRTRDGKPLPGSSKFGPGHYGANWGGVRAESGAEVAKGYPAANYRGTTHLGTIVPVVEVESGGAKTKNISIRDITDGTSFTLAFAEKRDSSGWAVGGWGGTEFDVYTGPVYDGKDKMLAKVFSGAYHPSGVNVAIADGSVRMLKPTLPKPIWYALTTRNLGEVIAPAKLDQ